MTDILMPALSPTMEEGILAKWLVKVGDSVRSGDVVAEIETDKATMEVEAVDEGVVEALLVAEGTEAVKVNTPIARLSGEGAAPVAAPSPPPTVAAQAPQRPELVRESTVLAKGSGRIFASPLARRLAAERGLDLATLTGSGPHGRIIRADVEAAGASPRAAAQATAAAPAPASVPADSLAQLGYPDDSYTLVPLDGMRRTVARRLTESARDIPHFPLTIDVEIDALLAARTRINGLLEPRGIKVSVNDLVIKAAALALRQVPEANASFTPEGIALHRHADISMAVAVEGGLITPILRRAEQKGLADIAQEAKDLAERARNRKLKPEEFQGGSFSISNLGMFGIRQFGSIINPPQGAILSVGAGEARAVIRDGQVVSRTLMTVTLTCDHRVIDGAIGARWLAAFRALIEEPVTMIV
ncbi:MAG: pyruvate dehydrogenase complex dihydrolipoamide acetyltransferase [Phenylobacterium sp.]|uniref:pyruvate dehydrogenase complex dihydrolipoamide acetyltransferase n=6 Tax=Phenylobacterium sp. TaxID=1871053 RepID=UPI0025DCA62A|nr:pyruvate dehydrogenase complex dihydrolipoamide acetyltransferase [Phenylobacterium sp.]MCA6225332.1 pyruvate dehydrogenase complex dihydrolipoamide acetyltransferase [Phenylobacterium sp.]MCA6233249.1 pyruvate dehydrogenase complex dihydrolipoamide acetyltransferase [Phenylobacterium sp.]MCA6234124.1 pyruvate dehydrogenase complex dihydrolipoamide acetyltransferase [Phenylobacterium sp.]MCA6250490.1 pyruvate dehydrogenase complex dihydrolipoamide acetyltransferase [Phenylobacterium sp.]MCA